MPLINAYGPAECSDDVATHRLAAPPPASLATVPIGRAIANTRLYVLDAHLQPVPIGVAGELCVGGTGVGRGYLNDPEQTRRSFLRDPFTQRRGARLYRTGDLARWRADGKLEFLGRFDHQVKIRGYRIELEEIEHVLVEHPDVQAAVVLARDDLVGDARLVAHIVAASRRQPKVNELRDFLKTRLPAYMIPAGFIFLERMPLTAHGKVDRPALAAIRQRLKVAGSEFVAPRNTTEQVLASIWADLLEVEDIGVFDNFFDLGGHSLLAGQVLARVAECLRGVVADQGALRSADDRGAGPADQRGTRDAVKRAGARDRARGKRRPPAGLHCAGAHAEDRAGTAWTAPVQPALCLSAAGAAERPRARAQLGRGRAPARLAAHGICLGGRAARRSHRTGSEIDSYLVVEDLAGGTPTGNDRAKALLLKKAELEAEQEAWTPFDMSRAPLFRTRLLRLGADDHVLLLILHHIIVDGWSIGVFMEEVSELYAALRPVGRRSCPSRRFSFPTSLAGNVGGPPAKQRPSSSPIGSGTCETPHPYSPPRVTLKAPCCARALRTNQFVCRKIWSRACAR